MHHIRKYLAARVAPSTRSFSPTRGPNGRLHDGHRNPERAGDLLHLQAVRLAQQNQGFFLHVAQVFVRVCSRLRRHDRCEHPGKAIAELGVRGVFDSVQPAEVRGRVACGMQAKRDREDAEYDAKYEAGW